MSIGIKVGGLHIYLSVCMCVYVNCVGILAFQSWKFTSETAKSHTTILEKKTLGFPMTGLFVQSHTF